MFLQGPISANSYSKSLELVVFGIGASLFKSFHGNLFFLEY